MKTSPTQQQMRRADQIDEAAIRALLSGQPLDPTLRWHAPGIPTFAHAYQLAKELGLTKVSSQTKQANDGQHLAVVRLRHPSTRSIRAGAGTHTEPLIARGFAFRNAVRQLLMEVD